MEDASVSWEISRRAIFTSLRTYLLAIAFSAAILGYSFAFPHNDVLYFRLTIIIVAHVGLGLAILISYHREKKWLITIEGDFMQIPRLGRKPIKLKISSVNSIQKYHLANELIGILIGQYSRSPVVIERRLFHRENDFYQCIKFLDNFSLQNQKAAKKMVPASIIKNRREAWIADFLALTMIFLYCCFLDEDIDKIDDEIIHYAGLSKQLFTSGEYYPIFTSFFLHYSPFHLLPNVISLSIIGRHVITIFGTARFTIILFLSTISGSLLSLNFSPYQIVLGASGGIFGLMGAHLCACAKFPRQLPGSVSISIKTIACILALQIIFDLSGAGGDIFSHLGGGAFGFLYAMLLFKKYSIAEAVNPSRAEIYISIMLFFICFFSIQYLIF